MACRLRGGARGQSRRARIFALLVCNIAYHRSRDVMASVVVCAEPSSWQQAGRFATRVLGDAELRSFEDLGRRAPVQPVLVYLTHPDYDHLRSLRRTLRPESPDVVIYYASPVAPQDAAQ